MSELSPSSPLQTPHQRLSLTLHFGFVLIGIINTLLGALLPALSLQWKMTDAAAGNLFFAQAVGSIMGSAASGYLIKRFGVVRLLVTGFVLMAGSLLALSLSNWTMGLLAISGSGLSLGLTIPTTNLVIAAIYQGRRAAAINLVNFVWGIGAAIGPLLIAWLGRNGRTALPLALLAALASATAIFLALCKPIALNPQATATPHTSAPNWRHYFGAYACLTGALLFFYVGMETSTGGWLALYAKRLGAEGNRFWAITQSVFWAGLLTGRAAAPLLLRRRRETELILACSFVSLSGIGLTLVSQTSTSLLVGAAIAGLGMSIIFPTTIAVFTERLGEAATEITGLIFVLGSLGGALLPWLVGQVSGYFNSLRFGMGVIFLGAILVCLLQAAIFAVVKRNRP